MNAITKMSSKGQVVIPKDVRDALGWAEGQALSLHLSGDRVVVESVRPKRKTISWEEFEKAVPRHMGPPVSIEAMDEAVAEMWRKRAAERF